MIRAGAGALWVNQEMLLVGGAFGDDFQECPFFWNKASFSHLSLLHLFLLPLSYFLYPRPPVPNEGTLVNYLIYWKEMASFLVG